MGIRNGNFFSGIYCFARSSISTQRTEKAGNAMNSGEDEKRKVLLNFKMEGICVNHIFANV